MTSIQNSNHNKNPIKSHNFISTLALTILVSIVFTLSFFTSNVTFGGSNLLYKSNRILLTGDYFYIGPVWDYVIVIILVIVALLIIKYKSTKKANFSDNKPDKDNTIQANPTTTTKPLEKEEDNIPTKTTYLESRCEYCNGIIQKNDKVCEHCGAVIIDKMYKSDK